MSWRNSIKKQNSKLHRKSAFRKLVTYAVLLLLFCISYF